jgi:hypothetical protein
MKITCRVPPTRPSRWFSKAITNARTRDCHVTASISSSASSPTACGSSSGIPAGGALEDADLKRYAVELGLDSDRFARDRTSPEVETRIERDLASGERSGVPGTPTFYVNGIRHDGGCDLESLRSAIQAT